MNVKDILTVKAGSAMPTVSSTVSVYEAIKTMDDKQIGALLVINHRAEVIGILSERDVLRLCHKRTNLDQVLVSVVMTKNLISVTPDDDLKKVMDLMIGKNIRHLPVLVDGKVRGLITMRDLILALSRLDGKDVAHLAGQLKGHGHDTAAGAH